MWLWLFLLQNNLKWLVVVGVVIEVIHRLQLWHLVDDLVGFHFIQLRIWGFGAFHKGPEVAALGTLVLFIIFITANIIEQVMILIF